MRHTFSDIAECCHEFMHADADHYGKAGSVSFQGRDFYSYRTRVARRYVTAEHDILLINSNYENYSVSTSNHLSRLRSAARHVLVFSVPNVEPETEHRHEQNWKHLRSEYNAAVNRFMHATAPWHGQITQIRALARHADRYHEIFGAGFPIQEPAEVSDKAARLVQIHAEQVRRAREREAARAEAARREELKRQRAERLWRWSFGLFGCAPTGLHRSDAAKEADWREGRGNVYLPGPVRLRVRGDMIETSRGARFPVADARAAWPRLERVAELAERHKVEYRPEGVGRRVRLGSYRVDCVGIDGTITAGCHKIAYTEARRCALEIGAARPTLLERIALTLYRRITAKCHK